jgi:Flp pilus assembly protein TadD
MLAAEDPSNAEAHRWLGAIYYDIGSQSDAVVELTEAARLNPLDYRPHRLLGLICTDQSLFGLAIEHYRTALKLGKDIPQPDIQADLAIVLIQRNRFAEALDVLATADPTATVWALRADCHDGLGNPRESRDAVAKSLLADPDNPKSLRLYGAQQVADGNAQNAIVPLQKVLQQDPHDTKARYQLAMAYLKLGQTEAGQREMDARDASTKLHEQFYAAVKQAGDNPANVEIREQLASIATALGKPEVAKRWELAAKACRTAVGTQQTSEESPL